MPPETRPTTTSPAAGGRAGKKFPPRLALLLLAILIGFCPLRARAAEPTAAAGPVPTAGKRLEEVLARIEKAAAGVESITCRMSQEKHLKAFSTVLESKGKFAFKRPDCWSWEIIEPLVSGVAVCGGRGRRWQRDGKQETFKIDEQPWLRHFSNQITAWTTADFPRLQRFYRISLGRAEPPLLKLVPRSPEAGRLIRALEIHFAADCRYVERIVMFEPDGDYTVIRFDDVVLNKLPRSDDLWPTK